MSGATHSYICCFRDRLKKKISKATNNYRRLQLSRSGENCLLILVGRDHLRAESPYKGSRCNGGNSTKPLSFSWVETHKKLGVKGGSCEHRKRKVNITLGYVPHSKHFHKEGNRGWHATWLVAVPSH